MIPAVIHKFINDYVRYRMYAYHLKNSWLFVYIFVMHLGKITINIGNHQNIAFVLKRWTCRIRAFRT